MQIAAILSLFETSPADEFTSSAVAPSVISGCGNIAKVDIVGETLLERVLSQLERLGAAVQSVISQDTPNQLFPSRTAAPDSFVSAWERAVAGYVNQGVDALLLMRVGTYTDLDYAQLLEFHTRTSSAVTQAYAPDGALDIALVSASALHNADGAYWRVLTGLLSQQRKFMYRGYVNRLASPQDFYKLVDDGLCGRCALKPVGSETRECVWQAADSEIDNSAVVRGPAFIGEGAHVGAGCTIGSGTSLERDCQVDCGTTVEQSWVM
ncbi:MAG TPA: hypothetical protein VGU90_10690, partial [Terriglobales bacterium]|nr:hypothetical protein [Terriglobales bacterium]